MGELFRKAGDQQLRNILEDVLQRVKSIEPDPADESRGMDQIRDYLDDMIKKYQAINYRDEKGWDFSAEKQASLFIEDEHIFLRPITPDDKAYYLRVCGPCVSKLAITSIHQEVLDSSWAETIKDQAFYCIVEDKSVGPVGYIGLKDTSHNLWEISIEFEGQYCHKGYGTRVLPLFLKRINEITGENQFQALVEVDNLASQGLMSKLGGELIDIYDLLFMDGERAEQYEAENMDLITDHMRHLATLLHVEPQKLLTHVLDYRLYVRE